MSGIAFDPELLQDFLTESGELLEQLDQDLVKLEASPTDPELLNQVFRCLHTIKGSASFLGLTNLVSIAHVAEGALNSARNRAVVIDKAAMDHLLAAIDIIKRQFDDLRAGRQLAVADAGLIAALGSIADGKSGKAGAPAAAAPAAEPAPLPSGHSPALPGADPFTVGEPSMAELQLPPGKAELLEFLVADVDATLGQIEAGLASLADEAQRSAAAAALTDLAGNLARSVDFFDFAAMTRIVRLIGDLAAAAVSLPPGGLQSVLGPSAKAIELLREQSKGLAEKKLIVRPLDAFCSAFSDLIKAAATADPTPVAPCVSPGPSASAPAAAVAKASEHPADAHDHADHDHGPAKPDAQQASGGTVSSDQTIRVEVGRLESLLNLVGELVLQKNRVSALSRQLLAHNLGSQEYREAVSQTAGALDRVTGDLQVAVMKTRMQPLDKLFGKYPRLIRDLARKLNKQINLVIEGGETEVDKSVIEELGDPLIHLMRNSADHGIESPEARKAAGKPAVGTITISASHQGSHVQILIRDDGRGLIREKIAQKAIEKGLYTPEQIAQMSDRDVCRIIFAAGFSTAETLSDVSGRGVGMDVVRANIEKLKGTIDLHTEPGKGCTVAIHIPLTVAIMSAMMVGVGKEIYAVPLSNILEIVRPSKEQMYSVNQCPVMRLRDGVLPLLNAAELFNQPQDKRTEAPFAVVIQQSEQRVGLMVSHLIGQQEIVIKPLDEFIDKGAPVSGATVRDDGGVSLIVDVVRLLQIAEQRLGR
ncbi:MAG: chemotaxis protein CheA [Phycisphaerales bacterium]|nr:chemotaxis protein CheA [Phycisphaerales bacterium]